MNETTVAILAGGLATRLRPKTESIPKVLIQVEEKAFLDYQLELIKARGFTKIVLCVGYLGEMVEEHIHKHPIPDLDIKISSDGDNLLGTGGALLKAFPLLTETFIVLYGDAYLDTDYLKILNTFQNLNNSFMGLMTVLKNQNQFDNSNVVFKNHKILVYDKNNRDPEMNFIDWGLSVFSKKAFQNFETDQNFDLSTVFQNLILKNSLYGYEVTTLFQEIGSWEGIKRFKDYLTHGLIL